MKRIKRKSSQCLNCEQTIDNKMNFCPNCGQENTNNYVSTKTLLSEFLNNYLSLDSRFIRTIGPFLFKPGTVTNDFLEGKRLKYAHPIRFYLVISLFHFLFFSLYQSLDSNENSSGKIINFSSSEKEFSEDYADSLLQLPDSLILDPENDYLTYVEDYEYAVIEQMSLSEDFSTNEIYDSLKIDLKKFEERIFYTILIKSINSQTGELNSYLLDKLPVIVFFQLPLYALLVMLFFIKKGFYIKHLILSIHIHSFLFLLLGVGWMVGWLFDIDVDNYTILCFIASFAYILFAFRKIYQQKYYLLVFKELAIGILYMFSAVLVFLIGIIISMLLM